MKYHTDIKIPPFDADVELDKLYPTEQTNEEWFCGLSIAEKAEVMAKVVRESIKEHNEHGVTRCEAVIWWDEWLKQPYKRE